MAKAGNYDCGNQQAASIILADSERYAGLPVAWARLWVRRHGAQPVAGRDDDARWRRAMAMAATAEDTEADLGREERSEP